MNKKKNNKYLSACCRASVKVGGKGMTHYYVCIKCGEPCDILQTKN